MRGRRGIGVRDGLLTVTSYPVAWCGDGDQTMHTLPAQETQSWFIVKVAVALSPILTFWAAGVIGWFLRRTLWARLEVPPPSAPSRPATNRPALRLRHCDGAAPDGLLTSSVPGKRDLGGNPMTP